MTTTCANVPVPGLTVGPLALKAEVASGSMVTHAEVRVSGCDVNVRQGDDSLWIFVSRPGAGGFALRTAYSPGPPITVKTLPGDDRAAEFEVNGAIGSFHVRLETPNPIEPAIRCTVKLTPAADLLIPSWPRDLYPLDSVGDPCGADGVVNAAQRGLNSGLVYLSLTAPKFGSLLYFQNLTALNDYFRATETTPDGCVAGQWPELGYMPPKAEEKALKAGKAIVLSDVYLQWSDHVPTDPRDSAIHFLDLLAGVYRRLERPKTGFHDWPSLAQKTLHDLTHSPDATITHYGHTYLHPYTGTEYPDSMVQLTVMMPLREYAVRDPEAGVFAEQLRAGFPRFFDPKLNAVRRYLPNVGKDKDKDAVDSWYLYHPLANLARLARGGDEEARDMFLKSLEFGIKVARHFHYKWPVQYNVQTLEVITAVRKPGDPGQSDVGGLYAYVCLQAYELTKKERYLTEATKAIKALENLEFQLEYQANITGWGAGACLNLFRITGDECYLNQSYVFLAGFFHNCLIWESEIENARHYPIFLGATCLHDGPYMALYECFETFAAFHEYLTWGHETVRDSVRMLTSEYCKYTLSRAWYYYPAHLPEDAISPEVRNGRIDRKLAFPMEDLYGDGQPAGQVGQEIYGSGAAFTFATRSYHPLRNAPFHLFCEYPIFDLAEPSEPCISFAVRGAPGYSCHARLIPNGDEAPSHIYVRDGNGIRIHTHRTPEGHWEFPVAALQTIEVQWEPATG